MEKIPTTEDFLQQNNVVGMTGLLVPLMIEFAKLHVEAALKSASENAKTEEVWEGNTGSEYCDTIVNKDSILNSYPPENIE
jgi:hypothetical protein